MFLVALPLLFLSGISAKKALIRLVNNSVHRIDSKLVDVASLHLKPRRSTLNQWILISKEIIDVKNNDDWDKYMSMALPTTSSFAPSSSLPTNSSESGSFSPSITPSNDITSALPHSSSTSPTDMHSSPVKTSSTPSHSPQTSQIEVPSLTHYPTNDNSLPSEVPTTGATPSMATPVYLTSAVPSTSESRSMVPSTLTQSTMPSKEQFRTPGSHAPSIITDFAIFACTPDNVLVLVQQQLRSSTQLIFKLGYSVESSFNESEYIDEIEKAILIVAVAGALQCENYGLFLTDATPDVSKVDFSMNTTRADEQCLSSPISQCRVFEAELQVFVAADLDVEISELHGYKLVRDKMDDGSFAEVVPNVDRCEYLRPLPLPPIEKANGSNQNFNADGSERLSVSPWSLATLSLLCAFGVIVIAALYRQRTQRNHRHMELGEDLSVESQLQS